MPNSILIPTAQNLPDGFCPQTWQETANAFAASFRVTLPTSASQIIVQVAQPAPEYQDRIWFQTDANNHVLAIRSWDTSTGAWERVDEEQYYFNDVGSANTIDINSSLIADSVTALSDIVGRLLIVKMAYTNTSASVTLAIDSMVPVAVKQYGGSALVAGNLQAGMMAMFIYNGTEFELLNPKYIPSVNSYVTYHAESPQYSLPAQGASQEWNHTLTGVPTYFDCFLICQNAALGGGYAADLGYVVGDRVSWVQAESGGANQEFPALSMCADATKLKLVAVASPYQYFYLLNKSTGGFILADPSKWNIQFVASKLVAA